MTLPALRSRLVALSLPDAVRLLGEMGLALATEAPALALYECLVGELERRTREAERLSAEVRRMRP